MTGEGKAPPWPAEVTSGAGEGRRDEVEAEEVELPVRVEFAVPATGATGEPELVVGVVDVTDDSTFSVLGPGDVGSASPVGDVSEVPKLESGVVDNVDDCPCPGLELLDV